MKPGQLFHVHVYSCACHCFTYLSSFKLIPIPLVVDIALMGV